MFFFDRQIFTAMFCILKKTMRKYHCSNFFPTQLMNGVEARMSTNLFVYPKRQRWNKGGNFILMEII